MASVTPRTPKVTALTAEQLQGVMDIFERMEKESTSRDPLKALKTYYSNVATVTTSNVVLQVKSKDNRALVYVTRAALLAAQTKYEATKDFSWKLGKNYVVEVQESASSDSLKGKGTFQFIIDATRSA